MLQIIGGALWVKSKNCYIGDFCHLLITFANSLDGQNVGQDLDPNCFDNLIMFLNVVKKVNLTIGRTRFFSLSLR